MEWPLRSLIRMFAGSIRDLAPIIVVVAVFQLVVIRQPFPDLQQTLVGLVFVVVGLTLFVQGLETGFFPLGESLAHAFARKGSLSALLVFAFCLGFGTSLVIGVFRIVKGWPLHYFIIGGYGIVVAVTPLAPPEIIGIAYDAGGVTTSTITVPLVTALGVGLASMIRGRDPMVDGFGLIAFASLVPIIFVLLLGSVL